jgi:tetratricopeptide (TPR) repeat protein
MDDASPGIKVNMSGPVWRSFNDPKVPRMGLEELKRLTLVPLIVFTLSVVAWKIVDNQNEGLQETRAGQQETVSLKSVFAEQSGVRSQRQRPQFQQRGTSLSESSPSESSPSETLVLPRSTFVAVNSSPPDATSVSPWLRQGEATTEASFLTGSKSMLGPRSFPTVVGPTHGGDRPADHETASDANTDDGELSARTVPASVWVALREPPVLQDPRQLAPQLEQAKLPVYTPRTPIHAGDRSFPRNLPRWIEQSMQAVDAGQAHVGTVDIQPLFLELQQYGAVPVVLSPEYEQQWQARLREAHRLATQGALASAEQHVESLLFELASTLDGLHECAVHQVLVSGGLRALREASDFYSQDVDRSKWDWVDTVALGHQTQLPAGRNANRRTDVEVLQAYYDFGSQMLIWGCGHQAIAADAMFVLGRIHQASESGEVRAVGYVNSTVVVPVEVIYHQIAMGLNPQHSLAANELGVLLGQLGAWESARDALLQSLAARPSFESWKNLSEVHYRLGEQDLANLAANEARLIDSNRQKAWPNGSTGVTRFPSTPSQVPTATALQPPWNRAL